MDVKSCWYREVCSQFSSGCSKSCVRYAEMNNLLELSNLPEYRWFPEKLKSGERDYDVFCELAEIKNNIKEFVNKGNNLYIYSSSCGNGKTSWAIKLMLAYFNSIWHGNCFRCRGVFINFPEFVERERRSIDGRDDAFKLLKDKLSNVDLLIVDDLSAIKLSEYMSGVLLNILDSRVLSGKSTIYTSNIKPSRLCDFLGTRLESRIRSNCKEVVFTGADWRLLKNG